MWVLPVTEHVWESHYPLDSGAIRTIDPKNVFPPSEY